MVPLVGLATTQWLAVLINLLVAAGAFLLAARPMPEAADAGSQPANGTHDAVGREISSVALASTSLALALSGFAAMGMEILWFRHFTLVLGGFRAVFSLLLSVILIGIGAGALVGGWLNRFTPRPVQWLMLGEGLFVAATVFGLATTDVRNLLTAEAHVAAMPRAPDEPWQWVRAIRELWLIANPMLLEVGIPALIMGLTFPMANAIVQRAEGSVGHRAGVLYFSNTLGAVCGSLAAGFLLLPVLGIQGSAAVLIVAAGLTIVPLFITARQSDDATAGAGRASLSGSCCRPSS